VIIAYLLTSTTTIPIAGKLSDIFGRKICFLTAIFIFEGGSIVCGAAPDMITLIIFRAVQVLISYLSGPNVG
jgi:MFS family permease